MKYEYKKRYNDILRFSERQLEQMSAHHLINWFMDMKSNNLKSIPNINPEWMEQQRYKKFSVHNIEALRKTGIYDTGRIKIRKTRKGFVMEMKFNWRSKGIKRIPLKCVKCEKVKDLNWHQFCEKCTKDVGGPRGIIKFWRKI